jgi:hypothetical protein
MAHMVLFQMPRNQPHGSMVLGYSNVAYTALLENIWPTYMLWQYLPFQLQSLLWTWNQQIQVDILQIPYLDKLEFEIQVYSAEI